MPHKRIVVFLLAVSLAVLSTSSGPTLRADDNSSKCDGTGSSDDAHGPQNDSEWDWNEGSINVPCYSTIYEISGEVTGDTTSVTRQISPGGGSVGGAIVGGYGSVGGSFFGPEFGGKGVVRLVVSASPDDIQDLAPIGEVVLLKTTDIKAVGLIPGDTVTFKCRKEYEPIGALIDQEKFSEQTLVDGQTYELDYCRLTSPVVGATQQ